MHTSKDFEKYGYALCLEWKGSLFKKGQAIKICDYQPSSSYVIVSDTRLNDGKRKLSRFKLVQRFKPITKKEYEKQKLMNELG